MSSSVTEQGCVEFFLWARPFISWLLLSFIFWPQHLSPAFIYSQTLAHCFPFWGKVLANSYSSPLLFQVSVLTMKLARPGTMLLFFTVSPTSVPLLAPWRCLTNLGWTHEQSPLQEHFPYPVPNRLFPPLMTLIMWDCNGWLIFFARLSFQSPCSVLVTVKSQSLPQHLTALVDCLD